MIIKPVAVRATIEIDDLLLDCYQLENGECYFSCIQVTSLLGKDTKSLRNFRGGKRTKSKIPYEGVSFKQAFVKGEKGIIKLVPIDLAKVYWAYWANKGITI